MRTVGVAAAKARLSELIDLAAAGETVSITRRGQLIAQITAPRPRKPIDTEALRALTADMTPQAVSAGEFIRQMRDDDRY